MILIASTKKNPQVFTLKFSEYVCTINKMKQILKIVNKRTLLAVVPPTVTEPTISEDPVVCHSNYFRFKITSSSTKKCTLLIKAGT